MVVWNIPYNTVFVIQYCLTSNQRATNQMVIASLLFVFLSNCWDVLIWMILIRRNGLQYFSNFNDSNNLKIYNYMKKSESYRNNLYKLQCMHQRNNHRLPDFVLYILYQKNKLIRVDRKYFCANLIPSDQCFLHGNFVQSGLIYMYVLISVFLYFYP